MRETLRALLVEDNDSDEFIIRRKLQATFPVLEVVCARSGLEALTLAVSGKFDVCFLDFFLPDSSGFNTLRNLANRIPELPVLVLTGHANDFMGRVLVAAGAQDYMTKDAIEEPALRRAVEYAMARKKREGELLKRAYFDDLTGLLRAEPFHRYLETALVRARRMAVGIALYFIDLNGFKKINDVYGHEMGDQFLRAVSQRIKECLRGYDVAARYGGDEFTLLIEDISSEAEGSATARRLLQSMAVPVQVHELSIPIQISIGIALFSPGGSSDAEELLQQADQAMYQAKKEHRNAYCVYGELQQKTG
jgi:diguanylate cyclase (GGDEF)-like protein